MPRRTISRFIAALTALTVTAALLCALQTITSTDMSPSLIDSAAAQTTSPPHNIKRIILITIDALRADVLSCYNPDTPPTPNIDALAGDGILFRHAVSAAPWTLPSLASILTGVDVSVHKMRRPEHVLQEHQFRTLAEYLRDAGYLTGAIGLNIYLAGTGFDRGFVTYDAYPKERVEPKDYPSSALLTEMATEWLETHAQERFFFWLHYFDPHMPYAPPKEYLPDAVPPPRIGTAFMSFMPVSHGKFRLAENEKAWLKELYLAEVQYVDDNIGTLVAYLKKHHLYNDALIILSSDHGEEFWEHGEYAHGYTLFHPALHVPLIIKLPGENPTNIIDQSVGTVSISPTVLDLCNVEYIPESYSGTSMAPLWQFDPNLEADSPVYSTAEYGKAYAREAITYGDFKYISHITKTHTGYILRNWKRLPSEELYDLPNDPGETLSLAAEMPNRIVEARIFLRSNRAEAARLRDHHSAQEPQERILDEDTLEKLKAIGYVQ